MPSPRSISVSVPNSGTRNSFLNCVGLLFTFLLSSSLLFSQSAEETVRLHMEGIAAGENMQPRDFEDFEVSSHHVSSTSSVHHFYFVQNEGGINIWTTNSSYHELNDARLSHHNKFMRDLAGATIDAPNPDMTAIEAVEDVADQMGYPLSGALTIKENQGGDKQKVIIDKSTISLEDIPVNLIYFPIYDAPDAEGVAEYELTLCWEMVIQELDEQAVYHFIVDATTGEIYEQINWVVECGIEHDHGDGHSCETHSTGENESLVHGAGLPYFEVNPSDNTTSSMMMVGGYNVIPLPIESPGHGARALINDPDDALASPFGWHDTNGATGPEYTVTRGNNVDAYDGGDNPGFQPDGTGALIFNFPFNPVYSGGDPSEAAAITNLFYWNNICHDVLYQYGFDEASGNFQVNNYGRGGIGGDDVRAEAQDLPGSCNANMFTPTDGNRPRMQMYTCGSRDGDWDNGVIIHEYVHGLTNRLTGGRFTSSCLNNIEQMGEGWSDWYGIMLTMEAGDMGPDARGIGTWLFGQPPNGPGIRPHPYSTNLTVNPHTYNNIISGTSVPHGIGSVWCAMLWEVTWALVDQYGFDTDFYSGTGGNNIALAIVTEALKLQPCSPGFVDGRDAILAADAALYGGMNECLIWEAFAKRGLGFSASQGSSFSRTDGIEAFDVPTSCLTVPPMNQDSCFDFTGAQREFVVPAGVTEITIETWGAQGNSNAGGVVGGEGGYATGTLVVTPGETIYINVGGGGQISTSGGFNGGGEAGTVGCVAAFGGGGGGASDVRQGGTTLADRVIIGGGGGGAGGQRIVGCGRGTGGGGGAGYYGGGGGAAWPFQSTILPTGGNQTMGGIAGTSNWTGVPNNNGAPGALGLGGGGGDEITTSQAGSGTALPGGIGGGTMGGNGQYFVNWTGQSGAGGSGYIGGVTGGSMTDGGQVGDGMVCLSYAAGPTLTITCPLDTTINCEEDTSAANLGMATADGGCGGGCDSIEFILTGSVQQWTVPAGVTSVEIETFGAEGAMSDDRLTTNGFGGLGGSSSGVLTVTPGEILYVYVGGSGSNTGAGGFNGGGTGGFGSAGSSCPGGNSGGGGGASDVRQGGTALGNRVIVGGGGGGGGRDYCNGSCQPCGCGGTAGGAGGLMGEDGEPAFDCGFGFAGQGINFGSGATQVAGGIGGPQDQGPGSNVGTDGGPGVGGNGSGGTQGVAGGGGGGGYYGGGGGGGARNGSGVAGGGGAGGSSYIGGVTGGATSNGVRTGDGFVKIKYCSGGGEPIASAILLDPQTTNVYWNDALNNLGIPFISYNLGTYSAWNTAVGAADPVSDVVIVDYNIGGSNFGVSNLPAFITAGGRVIFYSWDMDGDPVVPNLMGGAHSSDLFVPYDVFDWGGSGLYSGGVPSPLNFSVNVAGIDGDAIMLDMMSPGAEVAGLTPTPSAGQGMIIIGNNGRTILNGFSMDAATNGAEAIQMGENQLTELASAGGGGPATVTSMDVIIPGNCPQEYVIERTWTATDDCDNEVTCLQTITVQDTTAPVITCPASITIECDESTDPTNTGTPSAMDNCDMAVTTFRFSDVTTPGACPQDMTIARSWVAEDACGNISDTCVQIIEVVDRTGPVITCGPDFTVYVDEFGETQLVVDDILVSISDNCSSVFTYTIEPNGGLLTCANIGFVNNITLTAFDECLNPSSCTVGVMVLDTVPPVLTCPGDMIVHLGPDECDIVVWYDEPTAIDNCEDSGVSRANSVLIIGANNQTWNMEVRTGIMNNSSIGTVDAIDGRTMTPTLAVLMQYDAVMVYSDFGFQNTTVLGNNLADYIDAGGGVVTAVFANASVPIGGRFNSDNYWALQPAGQQQGITMTLGTIHEPGSPLVAGVTTYNGGSNSYHSTGTVQALATRVADYNNGDPLIVRREINGTNRVDLNLYPPSNLSRTDFWVNTTDGWTMMVNALNFVAPVGGGPTIIDQIDNTGLTNGGLFPIGETCLMYMATDFYGNTSTCEFCITVENYPNEITTLQCNNNIQLSLDETCMIDLNADMILEGGPYGCADGYDVVVTDDRGNVQDLDNDPDNGTQLGWEHVGHCYRVTVYDPDNGNSCWGTVCIEDKLSPTVQSCDDYTVSCGTNTDPACFGGSVPCPVVIDNCDPFVQSSYVDWETIGSCAQGFDRQIQRRWTFTDQYGNTNSCEQTITVELGTLFDVAVPGDYDDVMNPAFHCDEKYDEGKDITPHIRDFPFCVDGYLLDSAVWYATGGDPTIVNEDSRDLSGERLPMTLGWNCIESGPYTGHPSPRGEYYDPHPQWEFFGVCWGPNEVVKWQGTGYPQPADCGNIQYTFRDTKINLADPDCDAGAIGCFKVLRQWTVVDWCSGELGGHEQIIKVLDDEGPQIVMPDVLEVGTDTWKCEGIVPIPAPWIIDNCSEDVDYEVVSYEGQVLGNSQTGFTVVGLPLGQHILYIRAYDCCGNTSVDSLTLDVRDNTPPVCISEDRVQLSLTGNQTPGTNYSSICAVDLDQASYDNCTQWVWFKTIRMDELLGTVNGSFADNTAGCGGVNGDDDAIISGNQVYFDDCAKFCCEDADQIIMVVLRVHDVDPGVGPVSPSRYTPPAGDLVGRFTDCWVEIDVRDKAQPIVVAPPDIVVSCMFWFDDSEDALSDPNNATFGRVVTGLNDREKVKTIDIVCEQWCEDHPKYDYEPSSNRPAIWTQACDYYNAYYDDAHPDDKYELVWGFDGYVLRTCGATPEIRVDDRRECGQGLITRDILVTYQDPKTGGVVSYRDRQEIWVIDCDPFYVTEDCFDDDDCVEWPRFCQQPDPLDGCGADLDPYTNPDLGYPVIVNGCDDNCALVAVDYDDEVYTIEDTACFKVIRTWIIIDWCQYDPLATKTYDGDNPNEVTAGRWEFVQSIVVRDKVDPVVTHVQGDFCQPAVKDTATGICYGHIDICADATDDCSPDTWLVYDYKIDAYSDGVGQFGDFDFYVGKLTQDQASNGQVLSQGPTDCEAYNQGGYCNPFADDPTQPFCASGSYPVGLHTIYWFVEDGCGNVTKYAYEFEILDCKAPTPYCKTGIITVVMPVNGEICVWASDLDDGSFDNCTEQADLKFYFNGDPNMTSYCVNCDTFEARGADDKILFDVQIWVEDEEGNTDYCITTIEIQDNNDICPNSGTLVSGEIENVTTQEMLEDADIILNGQVVTNTENDGRYSFITPLDVVDINVSAYKNNDPMNGISTGDVVAIQRHLLGKDEFTSGYQMIAADINNNENVTAADISALRQLILGRFMDFTQWNGQTSWRFIDQSENLVDNVDPWPYTEVLGEQELLSTGLFDANFNAVKIGDLNGDAQSNGLTGNSTRGNGNVLMVVEDADLSAGNTYTMEVTSDNFNAVSGYQFTMKYDESALAFTGVESGALVINGSHVGTTSIADGLITMSWNDAKAEAISVGKNVVLFKMNFEVLSNSKASEAISMNSLMTRAEAYDAHIEVMGLDLEFRNGAEVVEVFELYQNVPNPFAGKTIVGYTLPREMVAVLTVYDVSGKVLLVKDLSGSKGYNETAISRTELNGAGVLYYQLDAADYTATKRMVLID